MMTEMWRARLVFALFCNYIIHCAYQCLRTTRVDELSADCSKSSFATGGPLR